MQYFIRTTKTSSVFMKQKTKSGQSINFDSEKLLPILGHFIKTCKLSINADILY